MADDHNGKQLYQHRADASTWGRFQRRVGMNSFTKLFAYGSNSICSSPLLERLVLADSGACRELSSA
jgi:hypothetical protein